MMGFWGIWSPDRCLRHVIRARHYLYADDLLERWGRRHGGWTHRLPQPKKASHCGHTRRQPREPDALRYRGPESHCVGGHLRTGAGRCACGQRRGERHDCAGQRAHGGLQAHQRRRQQAHCRKWPPLRLRRRGQRCRARRRRSAATRSSTSSARSASTRCGRCPTCASRKPRSKARCRTRTTCASTCAAAPATTRAQGDAVRLRRQ